MNLKPVFVVFNLTGCLGLLYYMYRLTIFSKIESAALSQEHLSLLYEGDEDIFPVRSNSAETRRKYFPSKDVLIRAVYFDDRVQNNYQNASVFLVLILKNITDQKLVTGCQVGDSRGKNYDVNLIGETKMWRIYRKYNVIDHEEVLVHCYDLPALNGSKAYLYYKLSVNSTEELRQESERLLMFPSPRVLPSSVDGLRYNLTVLTCTKVFGNPPWLKEWLVYQRAIGVDHVHLTADESFFRGVTKELSYFISSLIEEGFLSVNFWIMWLANGKEVWYHNQGLILEDCIYQFRGTYDYVFILDTDDFFVPRVLGEEKVHYYINKLCLRDGEGTCKFRWVEFYPDHYGLNDVSSLMNGNMTSLLKNYSHVNLGNRKSVHRINAILDTATHYAFSMMPHYKRVEYPVKLAYVAHIRKGKKPDVKKNVVGLP